VTITVETDTLKRALNGEANPLSTLKSAIRAVEEEEHRQGWQEIHYNWNSLVGVTLGHPLEFVDYLTKYYSVPNKR
jgi:hypothetical protein